MTVRHAVTLTIKQVPVELAVRLKQRAEANRRSLQKELLSIMEAACGQGDERSGIVDPGHACYDAQPAPVRRSKSVRANPAGKLTLDQLWQRARKLGRGSAAESADIVRRDRDARHGH